MRVFLCVLAVVALAQACVREGPREDEDDEKKPMKKEEMHRVLFGIYDNFPGFSYMDEKTGMASGMAKEVVEMACGACSENLRCDTVFIGDFHERCFDPESLTGEGLMDYHYHACVGWAPTTMRMNVFNFSAEFIRTPKSAVYAKPGTDLTDLEAMAKAIVGFRQYWYHDAMCLRKNMMEYDGSLLPDENVKIVDVDSWDKLKMGIDNDEYQFAMMPAGDPASEGLMMVGEPMSCTEGGFSLMHRKDMDMSWFDMCSWMSLKTDEWDPMGKHGNYRRMCQKWGLDDLCFSDEEMDWWDMKMMQKAQEKAMEDGKMEDW